MSVVLGRRTTTGTVLAESLVKPRQDGLHLSFPLYGRGSQSASG